MKRLLFGVWLAIAALAGVEPAPACTTIIITKGATADGSVLVSHSEDDDLADHSIVYVPAADWPEGARRQVYASGVALGDLPEYNAFRVPRLVDASRAPGYAHPDEPRSIAIGSIPQPRHTYAYLDGNYGIVNEHGLMLGECTNGAFVASPPEPGRRIFYSAELGRVALERCRTAREAVLLMGELIETYGYYGTGETLPIADAEEAWVMEMAPSPEGGGGLWVAQRVPDGHVFAAANEFRIREIVPGNPDQLYCRRLHEIIEGAGWRKPEDKSLPLDWLASVSHGEYSHPYYSLRRVWRVFSLFAPSLELSPWVDNGLTREYPFSIKPDRPLTLDDLKAVHRDHYEGTEFDLTKGLAAGPFGTPVRYLGPQDPSGDVGDPSVQLAGAWERPICMFYTGYVHISQLKPWLPYPINLVCWLALNTPGESTFVPLAVGPLPPAYELGDTREYNPDSAWWVYNLIGEYANLKYSYMIEDIKALAAQHERNAEKLVTRLQGRLKDSADKPGVAEIFAANLNQNAEATLREWRALFGRLVAKYNQGFRNAPDEMTQKVGYPEEWLRQTDYYHGPVDYQRRR